jgi:hypothetical protein
MLLWEVGFSFGIYLDLFDCFQIWIYIQICINWLTRLTIIGNPFSCVGRQPTNRPAFAFSPCATRQRTADPPASSNRARLSPLLSPFLLPLLSLAGRRRGMGEVVRPCPPPRMASTRRGIDHAVQPTYQRLYKRHRGHLPQTLATRGSLPISAATDVGGEEEKEAGSCKWN